MSSLLDSMGVPRSAPIISQRCRDPRRIGHVAAISYMAARHTPTLSCRQYRGDILNSREWRTRCRECVPERVLFGFLSTETERRMPQIASSPRITHSPALPTIIAALLAFLVACGGERTDPGLIQAPGFADESGKLARPWRFAHHASVDSYQLELADGVATITRIGHEPWAMLVQPVEKDSLNVLAGQRLAFGMDIRADLEDESFGPPFEPTALAVRMWHQPQNAGASALGSVLGPRQARTARLDLPPAARIPEWSRYTLHFTAPEDLYRMELSIVMTSGGRLELRNPSLHLLDDPEA